MWLPTEHTQGQPSPIIYTLIHSHALRDEESSIITLALLSSCTLSPVLIFAVVAQLLSWFPLIKTSLVHPAVQLLQRQTFILSHVVLEAFYKVLREHIN